MTDTRKMTSRQSWALYCITKQDYRTTNPEMTYDEASALIDQLNADKGYTPKAKTKAVGVTKTNDAKVLYENAVKAGEEAMAACTPTPMIVVDGGPDTGGIIEGGKKYFVPSGVCGFAWLHFKATTKANRDFLAGLKKAGLIADGTWHKDTYRGGYGYHIFQGGQSIQRKEVFGGAMAKVLRDAGIDINMFSRLD